MIRERLETEAIGGKICHIYRSKPDSSVLPVFYWGIAGGGVQSVMAVVSYLKRLSMKQHTGTASFVLVAYEVQDWNDGFSPWEASAAFGSERFGGKAQETLKWLAECCMPFVEADGSEYIKGAETLKRFPAGYSLAGLFSMWAYFESGLFDGAVSCSGSLWFSGWKDYAAAHIRMAESGENKPLIYLSLGAREEKTRNRQMASVGDITRELHALCAQKFGKAQCVLEWNAGGHFSEPDIRVAKGISWILQQSEHIRLL